MKREPGVSPGFCEERVIGPRARGELVSVVNAAGLVLDGIIFCPPTPRLVVVHVHGSLGNFYQQPFVRILANRFMENDVGLLSFNLTSHDGIAEGYSRDGDVRYVGGSLARFESCLDDLDALLEVARSICPRVVFQGHSLGCDRVLFYAERRSSRIPLILLSPCDSYRLQELWLGKERVASQIRRLSSAGKVGDDVSLLPGAEYGVKGPDGWTYSIPVSRDALLSIMTGPPFETLRVGRRSHVASAAPALVYMGTQDAIRGAALKDMVTRIRGLLPLVEIFTLAGDHSLDGCEDAVAKRVLEWVQCNGLLAGG